MSSDADLTVVTVSLVCSGVPVFGQTMPEI